MRLDGPMAEPFARAWSWRWRRPAREPGDPEWGWEKSGLIARKIAATLCSDRDGGAFSASGGGAARRTGDGGGGDVVVALSSSGETEECWRCAARACGGMGRR